MKFSSLWSGPEITLARVTWSFYIGIIIASLMILYNKRVLGAFVRKLLKTGATSPETAITLKESGFEKNAFVKLAVRNKNHTFRRTVNCTVNKEKLANNEIYEAKFYIPEEIKYKAEVQYNAKNTTIPVFIITIVTFFIVALLYINYLPKLLALF